MKLIHNSVSFILLLVKVKSADTCNAYRQALQRTEKKLSEASQENVFLKDRLNIIASTTKNGRSIEEEHVSDSPPRLF